MLREHDKYKIWLSIGGHIELNEDPNQAALREIKKVEWFSATNDRKIQPSVQYGALEALGA